MPGTPVPRVNPDYQLRASWPSMLDVPDGNGGAYLPNMASDAGTFTAWNLPTGTGTQDMRIYRDVLCGRLATTGANPAAARQVSAPLFRGPLELASAQFINPFRLPDAFRVARWSALIAYVDDAAGPNVVQTGFGFAVSGNATPTIPTTAGAGAGFGVRGKAGGSWEFFTKPTVAGAGTDLQDITLPVGATVASWLLWDMEIQWATPTTPATFRIAVNGSVVISRSWAPGHSMPLYSALATGSSFRPYLTVQNNGTFSHLHIGSHAFYFGRYTMEGLELLSPFSSGI